VQMLDLDLCLSPSVNLSYVLHTPLGLYNKILVGYLLLHLYYCLSPLKLPTHATLHHHLFSCLSQSNHILQMARNRNNNAENNDAGNPPPLTLQQVMMMQSQMLQIMQQIMTNMQQNQQAL
jgi:hypothetical protein